MDTLQINGARAVWIDEDHTITYGPRIHIGAAQDVTFEVVHPDGTPYSGLDYGSYRLGVVKALGAARIIDVTSISISGNCITLALPDTSALAASCGTVFAELRETTHPDMPHFCAQFTLIFTTD